MENDFLRRMKDLLTSRRCGSTRLILLLALAACVSTKAAADAGVLIPRDKQSPDPGVLSLAEMKVDVFIDNGDARVRITQIFQNHTDQIEEGTYLFALPDGSTVLTDECFHSELRNAPSLVHTDQRLHHRSGYR